MKKVVFSTIIGFFFATVFCGCGNSNSLPANMTEAQSQESNTELNTETTASIEQSSDEEIVEADGTNETDTDSVAQTNETEANEIQPKGTGNFQDYWINDAYFDFCSYMKDNGYWYGTANLYGDLVDEDAEDVEFYYCYDNDYMWEITYCGNMMQVRYMGGDQDNPVKEPVYMAYVNDPVHDPHGYENTIQINKQGQMVDKRSLIGLDIIVQTLHNDPYDMDPISHTELIYEIIR